MEQSLGFIAMADQCRWMHGIGLINCRYSYKDKLLHLAHTAEDHGIGLCDVYKSMYINP